MIDNNLNTDDWKISILGNIVYSIGSGTTPKADKLDYYDNGTINWLLTGDLNDGIIKETSNKITQEAFDNSSLKIYHSGNVVIAMYGATIGKLGILDIETTTNQACCSIDCGKKLFPKFLFYFLLDKKSFIISRALGGGQPNISQATVKNLFVRYPSYYKQQSIANYLDTKCCKIDASVATLKEMKEKYLSLKKSLINETVCRGLNKNVPLKSSGIDWIGDIPEYWEVKRMKNICTYISRGCTPNYVDDGIIYTMNQATFSSGYIDYTKARFTDKADFSALVKIDDLLIASTGGGVLGKVVYVDQLKGTFYADSHVSIVRSIEKVVNNKFLYYFFKIHFGTINALLSQGSTNQTELQKDELNNFVVPVPPIAEHQSIAKYLDDKCSKIDSIVANIDSQIEAYTKLKKSLISEVVTGKKRVI